MKNISNLKTLTKKEAYQYLNIGREQFNSEVKKGSISFLTCGKRIKFTIEALEKWRSNTTKHIDCSSEETSTTHTYPFWKKTEQDAALEKLRQKWNELKQKNTASKEYMRLSKNHVVN